MLARVEPCAVATALTKCPKGLRRPPPCREPDVSSSPVGYGARTGYGGGFTREPAGASGSFAGSGSLPSPAQRAPALRPPQSSASPTPPQHGYGHPPVSRRQAMPSRGMGRAQVSAAGYRVHGSHSNMFTCNTSWQATGRCFTCHCAALASSS